jgi:AcrR family transcriptional regulator
VGLRERKKDQTRSQLLDAALALIEKRGYQQTTLNEIAAMVNVSSRTFLRYFPTKDDVVLAWLDDIMGVLPSALSEAAPRKSLNAALKAAAREMLATYQAKGAFLFRIEEIIATSATLQMRKQQRIEALVAHVSDALKATYGDRYSDLTLDVYAGVAVSWCRASIRAWLATEGEDILTFFERAARSVKLMAPQE